jgi:tetratricopeptide (TPR) repeat protein
MRENFRLSRAAAIYLSVWLFVADRSELPAQTAIETPPLQAATSEEPSQPDLLKSYRQVREQLAAAALAIANNRIEAEAIARAQTAAITEKFDALQAMLASERAQQQIEARRLASEQERQQLAASETNRIILWVAVAFGGVGVLTMLTTTFLQWKGFRRIAEITAQPHSLPVSTPPGRLPAGHEALSGDEAALSSQRLMSVIDRMERRILELEHTTVSPSPVVPAEAPTESTLSSPPAAAIDQAAKIASLLSKGRALLGANQATAAMVCYDEILGIDANHPEALVKKGSALERLHQDQAAIDCYDRAIKADRNMALAYLSKGGIFNRLQRFDEAVECYEQALRVEKSGKRNGVTRVSVSGEWPTNSSPQTA